MENGTQAPVAPGPTGPNRQDIDQTCLNRPNRPTNAPYVLPLTSLVTSKWYYCLFGQSLSSGGEVTQILKGSTRKK